MARLAASKRTSPSIEAASLSRNALSEDIGMDDTNAHADNIYTRIYSRVRCSKNSPGACVPLENATGANTLNVHARCRAETCGNSVKLAAERSRSCPRLC